MRTAALIAWIATVAGGLTLTAFWLVRGGWSRPQDTEEKMARHDATRLAPLGISLHFLLPHALLAIVGLILWGAYTASQDDYEQVEVFAPIVLGIVAVLGLTMWSWARRSRRSRIRTPEDRLPTPLVFVHGLAAVTTIVLVVLALAA
jgi:hypothetical protein